VAWGPLAGYFAKLSRTPLRLTPVSPAIDLPFTPYVFDIGMGVRHGDSVRLAALNLELERRKDTIRQILDTYGVPTQTARSR
jgi:mxaJ protein